MVFSLYSNRCACVHNSTVTVRMNRAKSSHNQPESPFDLLNKMEELDDDLKHVVDSLEQVPLDDGVDERKGQSLKFSQQPKLSEIRRKSDYPVSAIQKYFMKCCLVNPNGHSNSCKLGGGSCCISCKELMPVIPRGRRISSVGCRAARYHAFLPNLRHRRRGWRQYVIHNSRVLVGDAARSQAEG